MFPPIPLDTLFQVPKEPLMELYGRFQGHRASRRSGEVHLGCLPISREPRPGDFIIPQLILPRTRGNWWTSTIYWSSRRWAFWNAWLNSDKISTIPVKKIKCSSNPGAWRTPKNPIMVALFFLSASDPQGPHGHLPVTHEIFQLSEAVRDEFHGFQDTKCPDRHI